MTNLKIKVSTYVKDHMKDYLFNYLLQTTKTSYIVIDCHCSLLSGDF